MVTISADDVSLECGVTSQDRDDFNPQKTADINEYDGFRNLRINTILQASVTRAIPIRRGNSLSKKPGCNFCCHEGRNHFRSFVPNAEIPDRADQLINLLLRNVDRPESAFKTLALRP